ncbi:MAG: hypothetical protein R2695_21330 [Acidimicrobiales bacterium]
MPDEMAAREKMPMDEAHAIGPSMPADFSMYLAFVDGSTVQLVYGTDDGETVSLFRHRGEVDSQDMRREQLVATTSGSSWVGDRPGAHVNVVDGSGYVWVLISADSHDGMLDEMMPELPSRSPGMADRARGLADTVSAPFRFWE